MNNACLSYSSGIAGDMYSHEMFQMCIPKSDHGVAFILVILMNIDPIPSYLDLALARRLLLLQLFLTQHFRLLVVSAPRVRLWHFAVDMLAGPLSRCQLRLDTVTDMLPFVSFKLSSGRLVC